MTKPLTILAVVIAAVAAFVFFLPSMIQLAGLHPEFEGEPIDLAGHRALIITTSHDTLNAPGELSGEATGVASSEMTAPYYQFLDAGMEVDLASIQGGEIPIDPSTLSWLVRAKSDDRLLEDEVFLTKVQNSLAVEDVDVARYDIIFLSGGWGAAYDFAPSPALKQLVETAFDAPHRPVLASVCHGVLGFVNARGEDGELIVAGRAMTGVTDKQVEELDIQFTPFHPETELRKAGALFEADTAFMDFLANHVVVDEERRFATGQNQNSGWETAYEAMRIIESRASE